MHSSDVHCCSIALVLDDTTFLNRLLGDFMSGAVMRFIILLWGEKGVLDAKLMQQMPVFTYKEIIELGQDSLRTSLDPKSKGVRISFFRNSYVFFVLYDYVNTLLLQMFA